METDRNRPVTGYPAAPAPNGYAPAQNPASTAYPYAAPPPPPPAYYNNRYYYQPAEDELSARRAAFLRRIFAVLIASMIITGTILFIVWLILRPRLPDFRVDSLSVSGFNLSNSLLSSTFVLGMTARNPNKKITLYYDHIEAGVFYESSSLAETTLTPFVQGRKNETPVRATFVAPGVYIDGRAVTGINGERSRRGLVELNLRMMAKTRFKAGVWRTTNRFVKVFCGDLSVRLSSNGANGTLDGGPRQCKVGL